MGDSLPIRTLSILDGITEHIDEPMQHLARNWHLSALPLYAERSPDDTTLIRWANPIRRATLRQLLDHITERARQQRGAGREVGASEKWSVCLSRTRRSSAKASRGRLRNLGA
jgi:hypothetical protein